MKKLAPFLVILAGCLWGTMGIFVRYLNAIGLEAMEIVEARAALTAAAMFAALVLFRRDLLRVNIRDLWVFAGGGIVSVILFNFCYFQTIQRASLSTAAILLYTSPVFVLLLSVPLFGEKLTKKKILCLMMAITGCGPTCLAMVGYYLTGDDWYTPENVAGFAWEGGYYAPGYGSSWTLISEGAGKLGLTATELPLVKKKMTDALEAGNPVILALGKGDFTSTGHYIVLTGVEEEGFRVNDPNSRERSEQLWTYEQLEKQIRNIWAVGKG